MSKILIIEDEMKLRNELKSFLESSTYEVEIISSFENTLNEMLNIQCDLILLDINLPNINGEALCKEYRKKSNTPIIMVTSKNTDIDEIISINYGADDFITKPYNLQVLLARMERLLKKGTNIIKYQNLVIDFTQSSIKKDDVICDLSRNENKILYYLIKNLGKIVSRDELMDYLWEDNQFVDDNTLTVNINRLRKKTSKLGYPNMIITKRGQGYIVL